jgi:hypothetical protein
VLALSAHRPPGRRPPQVAPAGAPPDHISSSLSGRPVVHQHCLTGHCVHYGAALYDAPALPPAQAGRPGPARRMPCLRRLLGSGARHQQALVAGEEGLARSRARWRQLRFSREYMLPSPIPLDDRCRARARVQARSSGSAAVQRRDERDAVARLEHIVELVLELPVGWTGVGAVGVSVKSDEWTRTPKRTVVDEDEDAGSTAGDGEEGGVAVSGSSNARLADHGHGTHTVSPSRKSSSRSRRRCLAR